MEVNLLGSALTDQLFQELPQPGQRTERTQALDLSRPREILSPLGEDRVELTGSGLIYTASQSYSYQNSMLEMRSDGTYFYRQVQLEASQDIRIALDFGEGGLANIDLEAVTAQMEQIVQDMQEGFLDSLQGFVQSLRSPALEVSQPAPIESGSEILSAGDRELLESYLLLIKQLAGEDSHAWRVASRLASMAGLSGYEDSSAAESLQSFQFEYSRTEISYTRVSFSASGEPPVEEGEPLVLDLDGDGVELRSMEQGVRFDIDNDGRPELTGFVTGDDALLALDKNGNGRIDGVAELFGDRTGARNGFEDLSRYDVNADGKIDREDPIYEKLRLFQDFIADGRSASDELSSLSDRGIVSIDLHPVSNPSVVAGNRIAETAQFTREDGSTGDVAEAYFRYQNA